MLRRIRAAVAVTFALLAAAVGVAPAAGAVTDVQSGYWRALPGPAQVPQGGLEVASDATGPEAVSAVRFALSSGESAPSLSLRVAQEQALDQVAVIACPVTGATAGWSPGQGTGSLADAPQGDCAAGSTSGSVSTDGTTMTFDLALLPANGSVVNVVLQPDMVASPLSTVPGGPSQQNPTFDVAFRPVTVASITVTESRSSSASAQLPAPSPGGVVAGRSPALGAALPASSGGAPSAFAPAPPAAPAPLVARDDGSGAAAPAAYLVTTKRNWRIVFAIGMIAADLLLAAFYLERRVDRSGGRLPLTIYDPPPGRVTHN